MFQIRVRDSFFDIWEVMDINVYLYRIGLYCNIVHFVGLLCDLLWSDPDKDVQGWGENDRGVSFTFGADVVSKFLNRHDLDLICRAHQVWMTISITYFKVKCKSNSILTINYFRYFWKLGRWGWLRVFRKTAIGDIIFCPQLLRRVW